MTDVPTQPTGGWAYPTSTARKAHYFPGVNARSFCGKYGSFGLELVPDFGPPRSGDCGPCRQKLNAKGVTS